MKIISYNVNSLRKRLLPVEELIKLEKPQILCFQEIKISSEADLPFDFFEKFGFDQIKFQLSSKKGLGGVLIAALKGINLENHCSFDFLKKEEGEFSSCSERHVSVKFDFDDDKKIDLHNFYVPSGGSGAEENDLESEKFKEKLRFFEKMVEFFAQNKSDEKIILGDLNIAPFENDVFNHKQLLKVISHTKEETDLFSKLLEFGDLSDCGRIFFDNNQKIFTWWSYRSKNWEITNRGRRLDHILISNSLKNKVKNFKILVDFRKKESPSDHCPVLIEI
jgi:exodeoxyribonuclease-3